MNLVLLCFLNIKSNPFVIFSNSLAVLSVSIIWSTPDYADLWNVTGFSVDNGTYSVNGSNGNGKLLRAKLDSSIVHLHSSARVESAIFFV